MNKKVLSAILFSALFAGTGTFTSCIDTDEPAGIEELRGAKAELLKAQAAMQLADEAYRRAQVANQELLNEAQRITNQAAEIDNQIKALELKIAQAESEALIAEYLLEKQKQENELAKLAETFKADMLKAQAETVKAQTALDQAIKTAEVAKLTLTDEQQAQLNAVIAEMGAASAAMTNAHAEVVAKQDELRKALIGDAQTVTLASLEWNLLDAQNDVKAEEISVADAEKLLALAKDFDTETWAAQLDSLRADSLTFAQKKAAAQVDLDAFYLGAEYQAAEKAYADAALKLGKKMTKEGHWSENKTAYVKGVASDNASVEEIDGVATLYGARVQAAADSAAAVAGQYDFEEGKALSSGSKQFQIEAYESETADKSLQLFLNKAMKNVDGYNKGVFSYGASTYSEGAYRKDSAAYKKIIAENPEGEYTTFISAAFETLKTVEGWVEALSTFKADTNGIAWSQLGLDQARKDSADAQKAFDKAKAEWQILVDAVNGKKTVAPTDSVLKENGTITWSADIKGAVAAYNDSVASLTAAVAKYNTLVDSLAKSETALADAAKVDTVAKLKAKQYFDLYYTEAKSYATGEDLDSINSIKNSNKTYDYTKFDNYLTPVNAAKAKAAADVNIATWVTNNTSLLNAAKEAAATKVLATAYGTGGALVAVKEATDDASDAMRNLVSYVATAQNNVEVEYAKYLDFLEKDYGQVIAAKNLNKIPVVGSDSIAVGEAKYVTYNNNSKNIDWDVIAAEYGVATITEMKNQKNTADSIVNLANGVYYGKYIVKGGAISAAVEANLSNTEIDQTIAIASLLPKSETAFGTIFDWKSNEQARLVEVTEEMVKADAEKKQAKNYKKYGKLGALLDAEDALALVIAYKDADKLVEPVLAEIEAHFAALKAEIAANSALVAAVEKKADEAWAAFNAGEALVEKALADRDALTDEAEAEIELLGAIIAEKKAVIQSATAQLEALYPGVQNLPGALTTEKLVQAWEEKVTEAKGELVKANDAVARAEKEIELFKAGEYSQAYSIEYAKVNLEAAQEAYEAAVEYYEYVAAQFDAILAVLAK